ncbi:hypothetical protein NDU88_003799 [Pleurodeles waltl]|uniref:Uncharacterized protein n=1 Tax=Pleurodeles waltl TaxID=8319 RepID=A0AAV7LJG8_PLEWA|nr:hypothetical protein NDU88_003799 [Pleurodeles waltl]
MECIVTKNVLKRRGMLEDLHPPKYKNHSSFWKYKMSLSNFAQTKENGVVEKEWLTYVKLLYTDDQAKETTFFYPSRAPDRLAQEAKEASPVTEASVISTLHIMRNNGARGPTGIPAFVFKSAQEF